MQPLTKNEVKSIAGRKNNYQSVRKSKETNKRKKRQQQTKEKVTELSGNSEKAKITNPEQD